MTEDLEIENLTKLKIKLNHGQKVELFLKNGKPSLKCLIRNRDIFATPEEIVRQSYIYELVEDYGYSLDQMQLEVKIKMGATYATKKADIVVYEDASKRDMHLIVENKKQGYKAGIDQLQSYMNATGVIIGVWTNGIPIFQLRERANHFRTIHNIPKSGETLESMSKKLTKKELKIVENISEIVKELENKIIANQGENAFNELFKIIFSKLYDEKFNLKNDDSECVFKIAPLEKPALGAERIRKLFVSARDKWKGVFGADEVINLNDNNLVYCASAIQEFYFIKSKADVLGSAFEIMVNPEMKGDKGQYFTPRHVIKMCVSMLNPKEQESILDPACGSGGFLIETIHLVYDLIDSEWDNVNEATEHKKDYAQEKVKGIDYDPRLIKVSKAYMIIWGDGRSHVFKEDSLNDNSWQPETKIMIEKDFDVIMTNPPFAGNITPETNEAIRQFDLAYHGGKLVNSQTRAILFIEQCLNYLKEGGRMAIILPQGILNNLDDNEIREHIDRRARWLAIVGLNENTFKPFTNTKTSVIFLQKWGREDDCNKEVYPIFTAVSKKSGKDKSGKLQYKNGDVDSDLKDIANDFVKFAKEQKLYFFDGE